MDKKIVEQFRKDFEQLNKALELKYKLAISLGNIKYSTTSLSATVSAIESLNTNELGEPDSFEKLEFNKLCRKYGHTPEDYRCKGMVAGRNYVLVGFKDKARKNIYIVENEKGERFIAPEFRKTL